MTHAYPFRLKPAMPSAHTPNDGDDCVICGSRPSKPETRCWSVNYCSTQCQEIDWPGHKLVCRAFSHQPPRPSPAYKRAIFFPHDKSKPVIKWVLCENVRDDTGVPFQYPHASESLGNDDPVTDSLFVERSARRDQKLPHVIEIVFRDTCMTDGSQPNHCIFTSVGSAGPIWHQWRGPVIIFRRKGASPSARFYEDITLADYRHALDFFRTHYDARNKRKEPEHRVREDSPFRRANSPRIPNILPCRTPSPLPHKQWAIAREKDLFHLPNGSDQCLTTA